MRPVDMFKHPLVNISQYTLYLLVTIIIILNYMQFQNHCYANDEKSWITF